MGVIDAALESEINDAVAAMSTETIDKKAYVPLFRGMGASTMSTLMLIAHRVSRKITDAVFENFAHQAEETAMITSKMLKMHVCIQNVRGCMQMSSTKIQLTIMISKIVWHLSP